MRSILIQLGGAPVASDSVTALTPNSASITCAAAESTADAYCTTTEMEVTRRVALNLLKKDQFFGLRSSSKASHDVGLGDRASWLCSDSAAYMSRKDTPSTHFDRRASICFFWRNACIVAVNAGCLVGRTRHHVSASKTRRCFYTTFGETRP